MSGFIKRIFILIVLAFYTASPAGLARADHGPGGPSPIEEVDFEQKLDAQIPLDLDFRDESGRAVQLNRYFGQRPVILLFAYYECPMLCTLALNDLTEVLKQLSFDVGDQFEVVTVSMDPGETPELASAKKAAYLQEYGRPGAGEGWHFLTGEQTEIDRLADSVGFRYVYDPEIDQYAHPTGLILLTPEGRVSRYILGIGYDIKDVRLGLVDASAKKIGSPIDQFYLLCYAYDPEQGKYTLLIERVLRLSGLATAGGLGILILWMVRRDRAEEEGRSSREVNAGGQPHD